MRNEYLKQGVIFEEKGEIEYDYKCNHYLDHNDTPKCLICGANMCESDSADDNLANGLKFRWWCRNPECSKKRKKTQSIQRIIGKTELLRVGVPERFLNCTVENFEPVKNTDTKKTVDFRRSSFEFSKNSQGILLFTGKAGTGKTHLAVGILREIMGNTNQVYFKRTAQLLFDIQETFGNESSGESTAWNIKAQFCKYKFLVLDDFGTEKPTDWSVMILGEIINSRYSDNLPTIITSNLSLLEINDQVDPRIASRISKPEWKFCFKDYRNRRD